MSHHHTYAHSRIGMLLSVYLLWSFICVVHAESIPLPAELGSDIPPGLGITPDGKAATETVQESAGERRLWDNTPIPITLQVGKERMIHFPGAVRVGIPGTLTQDLRTQSQNGTVYWLAHKPFPATRIQLQDSQNGQFYLVDLAAIELSEPVINSSTALSTPITIVTPETVTRAKADAAAVDTAENAKESASTRYVDHQKTDAASDYIRLTRHAAQQLYAPTRLLTTPAGIHAAPVEHSLSATLMHGGTILAEPVAAWRKGTLYVTAVKLTNRSAQPVELDPRLLRGPWRTATFQHARLDPSFMDSHVTAVYLISDRPFAELQDAFQ